MEIQKDSLQSKTIEWLRFALAAAVVLLHAGEISEGTYGTDFYSTLRIVLSQGICRIAVPCFFLISGYLFFSNLEKWDTQVWFGKIKKRCRTLLVPYILWNILALFVGAAYGLLRSKVNPSVEAGSIMDFLNQCGWLNIFWASTMGCPLDYPLWFIRDLIIYVAVTPLVFCFARKCGIWGLVLMFVGFGFTGSRDLEGFFFFTLGCWLRINSKDLLDTFSTWEWPSYVITTAGIVLIALTYRDNHQLYSYIKYVYVFFGTIATLSFSSMLLSRGIARVHPFLSASSFFIYASHAILILHDISHYIIMHLLPYDSVAMNCVKLFLKPSLAIAICLGLYWLMRRFTPRTLAVLTGGRG